MLKEILAISGKPGLFKLVSKGKNCLVVEPLNGGKRTSVSALGGVMSMEDVAIYTEEDTVSMSEVFSRIRDKENSLKIENFKKMDGNQIKTYFETIVPDFDKERVYVSDIKKTISWYNEIVENNLLSLLDKKAEETSDDVVE